ncbi:MAG: hypothetical protein ABJC12_09745 [Saprospiraceae bacterium]
MNIQDEILRILRLKDTHWVHASNLPCVYTFYKELYYINLCRFRLHGNPTILLTADNRERGEFGIVDKEYKEGDELFVTLNTLFDRALETAEKIDADRKIMIESPPIV